MRRTPSILSRLRSLLRRHSVVKTQTSALTATRVTPPGRNALTLSYAPITDAAPDAGEIIWTWIPYAEGDGRGKDRPVLVIGRRDSAHVYAVRLTSHAHPNDSDYFALGAGEWDSQRRPSWVDLTQIYLVPEEAMRREAAALDIQRFTAVAAALHHRYGWTA